MNADAQRVGPVSLSERIVFIDVVRGMALFGILAANMRAFFAPLDAYDNIQALYHGRADLIAQVFIDIFIQGKFITIFSFLFGLGFAIQMSRAEARGARFLGFYPRRLIVLAIFGLIHGIFIWAGDVLLTYALSGGILLLFRNRQQKTLLWWAGGLFSIPLVLGVFFFGLYFTRWRPHWMNPSPPDLKKWYAIIHIYAGGTAHQIMAQNWIEWKDAVPTQLFAIYAVGLFMLGMWVWRAGIIQRLDEYRPVLKSVCAWCLPVGLVLNAYVGIANAVIPAGRVSFLLFFASIIHFLASHILSAGYLTGLVVLFTQEKWRRRLLPFAAVGRMALTDYLMQSVLCTLFFYHYTTGLYGRMGPALGLIPTVLLYGGQLVFSNWWLKRYRFGPMEWLWRGMTYGKFPTMRLGPSTAPTLPPDPVPSS